MGRQILIRLLQENGYDISDVHGDCGLEVYENEKQDTHSGGIRVRLQRSGFICSFNPEASSGRLESYLVCADRSFDVKDKFLMKEKV